MTRIGAVCLITIGVWVVIEVVVGFVHWKHHCFAGTGARAAVHCTACLLAFSCRQPCLLSHTRTDSHPSWI